MVAEKDEQCAARQRLAELKQQPAQRQQRQIIFNDHPTGCEIELLKIRIPTAQSPEQQEAQQRYQHQPQLFIQGFHFAQFHGGHEAANQHSAPKQGHVFAGFNGGSCRPRPAGREN